MRKLKFYEIREKDVKSVKLFQLGTFEFGFAYPKKFSMISMLPIRKIV
jgi:hypothetical protein